ncbi:unnamed protein product [Calypogeia fissa]
MAAAAMKVSWKPDTGLPFVGCGGGSSSSSARRSKASGDLDPLTSKKLPVVNSIWQKQKGNELVVPPADPRKQKKLEKKDVKETAGSKWFDMPAATMTPEMKRELQLLRLRGVLDPKRHYKVSDSKAIPKFFQVGTVVEGAADFYSGRLTKKERKSTFAEELLTDSSLQTYRKRKYLQIQEQKEAGGKKFWKKKKNRQKPSWAKT